MSNRHPVDRLAYIRAEMRELRELEEELRNEILKGECDLYGDEYEATVFHSDQKRVNMDAIRQEMGSEWISRFVKSNRVVAIRLKKREALEDACQD